LHNARQGLTGLMRIRFQFPQNCMCKNACFIAAALPKLASRGPDAATAKARIIAIIAAQGHISQDEATQRFNDAQARFTKAKDQTVQTARTRRTRAQGLPRKARSWRSRCWPWARSRRRSVGGRPCSAVPCRGHAAARRALIRWQPGRH